MSRLDVLKTYKLYIDGAFPRSESGHTYPVKQKQGNTLAMVGLSTRKDVRQAVVAARKAFESWSNKTHFNRSQILYRIAEMLETRKDSFVTELMQQGATRAQAQKEVSMSIDRCVYYSGWCDKYTALFSSVNPVASPHFNFSVPEPMGVVSILGPETCSLLGAVSVLLPVIAGGNTCVYLASESKPLCALSFGEVLATSDVPAGVVNILSGKGSDLHTHLSSHMDVNAVVDCRDDITQSKVMQENAALNVKRYLHWTNNWMQETAAHPYLILDVQEIKTTWHPIEPAGAGGGKY